MSDNSIMFCPKFALGSTVYAVVPDGIVTTRRDWVEYRVIAGLHVVTAVAYWDVAGTRIRYILEPASKGQENLGPIDESALYTSWEEATEVAYRKNVASRPRPFAVEVFATLSRRWTISVTATDKSGAIDRARRIIDDGDGDPKALRSAMDADPDLVFDRFDIESVAEGCDVSDVVVDCTKEG